VRKAALADAGPEPAVGKIVFNIFTNHCFDCHFGGRNLRPFFFIRVRPIATPVPRRRYSSRA